MRDGEGDGDRQRRDRGSEDDRLPPRPCLEEASDEQRRGERPDAEEEVQEIESTTAARRIEVQDQAVGPAVKGAHADPERDRREQERLPRRCGCQAGQPKCDQQDSRGEDHPATDPLGDEPPTQSPAGRGGRIDEEEHPDPGIGLAERRLDRSDERGNQQADPADQHEPRAAQDGGRAQAGRRTWHGKDATGAQV